MSWEIKIKRADNGYIVTYPEPETRLITELVFEFKTGEHLEATKDVIYEILEYFDVGYSKKKERNIVVEIKENNET